MTKRTWNYRIVRKVEHDEETFAIHEVHYDDGRVCAVTVNPVAALSDSAGGVGLVLQQMLAALDRPVLDYDAVGEKDEH